MEKKVEIGAGFENAIRERVARLNRRAAKLGVKPLELTISDVFMKKVNKFEEEVGGTDEGLIGGCMLRGSVEETLRLMARELQTLEAAIAKLAGNAPCNRDGNSCYTHYVINRGLELADELKILKLGKENA